MKQRIIRQFNHGNWAHIFLYAAVLAAKKNLDSSGTILPLEIHIDGYTLGKIIEISVEGGKKELVKTTVELLRGYKIDECDFRNAAEQVAIKNGWRLHLLEDELKNTIRDINAAEPWIDETQLNLLCADENDEDLVAPGVRYDMNGSDVSTMGFRVFVDNCQPELRALTVLVIDSLISSVINEIDLLGLQAVSVDSMWAEGLPVVGTAVVITSTENVLKKLDNMRQFFDDACEKLKKRQFEKKIAQIIAVRANDVSELFCTNELAWYSGVVMGTLGWKDVATEENVKMILSNIQVEVLKD